MAKKIYSLVLFLFLGVMFTCVFFLTGKEAQALHEGFTATELASSQNITVDGAKDAAWDSAVAFKLDTVRQYNLNGGANNPSPATGEISVMYTSSKLYLFAEITDSTKLSTVSAWDPFNVLDYDSYKYNADYLNIQLDIKHNNPTDYGQTWGSAYNDGKDVAAHFELAAGAGELTYSANGSTGWVYDTSNEMFTLSQYATTHSTIYSVPTETGYTFEMVIDLSGAGVTDFVVGKTIGLYVGYWDRYDSCGGSWGEQSLTTTAFEWDNYVPWNGPGWLPEVTFVANNEAETPEPTPSIPTATQTSETIGSADGVKDEAYNAATAISVSHVAWESENPTPATANMYLLWDTSYLYVFVEVTDDTHYGYQQGAWLESRDALEMIVDLYHNTSYVGGYGGGYRGDKMCEGYYKIAAGVGQASVDSTIQGIHWLWDDQKHNGSYASQLTETGYTVEYKIALGKDAAEFMVADREIGLGVKIYDKHADDKDTSKIVLEGKNDGQHEGPHNLSSIKLVRSVSVEVSELFNKYNNEGSYVKESCIYIDSNNEELKNEVAYLFHGKTLPLLERTTHYSNGRLWMEETNSGYKTDGSDMVHFKVVDGVDVVDYKVNGKTLDEYYVSLNDFVNNRALAKEFANDSIATLLDNWSKSGSVYYTNDANVLEAYRLFTAPLWLNTDSSNANYITYSFASIEEVDGTLVMSLLVSSLEIGKLSSDTPTVVIDGVTYYAFSQAVIRK